jgi:hypothetical protein
MLAAVALALAGRAGASEAETPYDAARVMAFNLFAQGVAFFQSAQTLIAGFQPAEALPSLRGLTLIAARFEQMSNPEGAGLGIVLRMALNSPEEIGADPDHSSKPRGRFAKLPVISASPSLIRFPGPESTAIHRSLNAEMHLARNTSEGSYAIVSLHVQVGTEQPGFHTKRQPDAFTDMIITACVIAQLDLLKHAASPFNWSLDVTRVDELIAKATAINNAAAQGEPAADK